MQVDQVLRMKAGTDNTSYARNSLLQRRVMVKSEMLLEECIREVCNSTTLNLSSKGCMMVADLGSSSGPNALTIKSSILNILTSNCGGVPSELAVFLNDLPGNDFNTIFKMMSVDHDEHHTERGYCDNQKIFCSISATPGSFYKRLFPANFLHFVHSSASLHWLSQVPNGLTRDDGEALNKRCIHMQRESLPKVCELYSMQFERDFTSFLRHRSKEIVAGGRMLLTMPGRPNVIPDTGLVDVVCDALNQMAFEGLIDQEQLDKFNMPFYTAMPEEIKEIITAEGSFSIHKLESFSILIDHLWEISNTEDDHDEGHNLCKNVHYICNMIRATLEPLLASEFGEDIIKIAFKKVVGIIEDRLITGKTNDDHFCVIVSLVKNNFH